MELGGLTPERALDLFHEKRDEVLILFKSSVGEEGSLSYSQARPLFRHLGAKYGVGPFTSDRALLSLFKIIEKDTFDSFTYNDYIVSSNTVPKDARGRTAKLTEHPFAETVSNAAEKHTLLELLFISDLFQDKEKEFAEMFKSYPDGVAPMHELSKKIADKGSEWGFGSTLGDRMFLELFPALDLDQLYGLTFAELKAQIERRRPPDLRHKTANRSALYATSSSVIGSRAPSQYEIPQSFYGRYGAFTKSFPSNYQNNSLNTAVSHSKVHQTMEDWGATRNTTAR
eukprot:TRINITY_DN2400_c0_g1_i1.p1 TRINITY_DN2400_c0_g1~~TRINITY_DN2400_c0_g1_i1.p1  ORF type:complete len:285 (+),score=69.03 TRINITY_DN2400_c0_g1_i1:95-949(+)